ncbi:PAS domain-containing protein [Roseomonas sp. OT10]|uniref:PAS domain-containing protein n=1 Tax=Roseomonas cutis TaxID=2897332 RepID=UPI001E2F3828|nr:PAS domain-containing protein [Roseomonas sp. OT10]UFN50330.1 PAS domain-containing protein [Roseomonas sp. OT10]
MASSRRPAAPDPDAPPGTPGGAAPACEPTWDEPTRLATLRSYGILDTPPEPGFDELTALAGRLCHAPIAVVTLVDEVRQWFKSEIGLGVRETERGVSICAHAMLQRELFVVPDTTRDPRFAGNPLVTDAPHLRFYAGAPLHSADGLPLGSLCVLDYVPRPDGLAPDQASALLALARQVMNQLELRRALAQRDAALAARHEVEERMELALDAADTVGTYEIDLPAGRLRADARFARLYGLTVAEAASGVPLERAAAAMLPEDRERVLASLRTAVAGYDTTISHEYRLHSREGGPRWVATRGRFQRDGSGQAIRLTGVILDVTERKRVEQVLHGLRTGLERTVAERTAELARERAQLDAVLTHLPLGVLILDAPDGTLRSANAMARTILGSSGPYLFQGAIHPDGRPYAREEYPGAKVLRSGQATGPEDMQYRHRNGEIAWLSIRAAPVRDELGQPVAVVVLIDDITRQRQTEEALRQSQKMEAVGQLTGGIAHDFNNLLTGIVGSLELLRNRIAGGRPEGLERYIGAAIASSHRAAALTHRLLAFARRQPLDPRPVDVNRLVASMEDLLRRSLGEAIQLEIRAWPGLWSTLCDANQLENTLLNLVINARDAMPGGGRVVIETRNDPAGPAAEADGVLLRVVDNGTGMTPEVMRRAFDPFFTTKPIGQGTGLGLSMIYGFVRQSGGQVGIESRVGQGTALSIRLPRHSGAAEAERLSAASLVAPDPGAGETVLVVEDEDTVRQVVIEVLRELGYRALEAPDGPHGLALMQSVGRIDLLVTDVGLPGGMNGRQLAEAARALRPELKVLFITGYADDAFGPEGLAPGMQMLTKPFTLDALAARLREMVCG